MRVPERSLEYAKSDADQRGRGAREVLPAGAGGGEMTDEEFLCGWMVCGHPVRGR